MAGFERQQQILAPGGLNLLGSADLIKGTDSIAMKNFRSDGSGVLRTRLSNSTVGITLTGYVHTLYRTGNDRWFGAGSSLYRNSSLVASGFDGVKLGIVTLNNKVFVMNRSATGVWDNATSSWAATWYPLLPFGLFTASGLAGGELVEGIDYSYRMTYLTAGGEMETYPSFAIVYTPTSANRIALITRPGSGDARVTHWNLYRVGNTVQNYYRVNENPIPIATTTFKDNGTYNAGLNPSDGSGAGYSDEEITRLGFDLDLDPGVPPVARCLCGPYYGRLIAGGSAAHPNRIWWSEINRPHAWPAENYVDIGDANDEIVQFAQHDKNIRVYMRRSIGRLAGDPGNGGTAGIVFSGIGLIGPNGVASWGESDFFVGQEGIYRNNGDVPEPFSAKVEPLFRPITISPGADPDLQKLSQAEADRQKNWLAVKNGRMYFGYVDALHGGQTPNQMLVCNLATGDWWAENAPGGAAYHALYYEGQGYELIGANSLSVIYALETALPETNVIPLRWTSGWFAGWPRERTGRLTDLVIEHSVRRGVTDRTLSAKLKLNNGDTADLYAGGVPVATAAAGANRLVSVFPFGVSNRGVHGRNCAVLIEGDSEHETSIYSVTLHYMVEPKDARTFDSRPTDFNDPRWKDFDLLDLSIWNRGVVTWDMLTGPPGGVVTSKATGTFAAVADRSPVPMSLLGCEGVLVQVVLTSPELFWLYAARLRYRAVGVYLTGNNKLWRSSVHAMGI